MGLESYDLTTDNLLGPEVCVLRTLKQRVEKDPQTLHVYYVDTIRV